ncbi:hypothetical protein L596_005193 [Steinernema carpocapsae]|uniref:Uncharacterized protein n=1 Tax=Steinernema carpocapsae TaxID=34508 RepID=A0A4U8UZA4_STECR|nr:hypothetical protein L596_005193 [Steinernema carpocapsae]
MRIRPPLAHDQLEGNFVVGESKEQEHQKWNGPLHQRHQNNSLGRPELNGTDLIGRITESYNFVMGANAERRKAVESESQHSEVLHHLQVIRDAEAQVRNKTSPVKDEKRFQVAVLPSTLPDLHEKEEDNVYNRLKNQYLK